MLLSEGVEDAGQMGGHESLWSGQEEDNADENTEHVLNTCYNLFSHCYSLIELFFFVSCHRVVCKGRWGIKRPS